MLRVADSAGVVCNSYRRASAADDSAAPFVNASLVCHFGSGSASTCNSPSLTTGSFRLCPCVASSPSPTASPPTPRPTASTVLPTKSTFRPTMQPTTATPSYTPTKLPSERPTLLPSDAPSDVPTEPPTEPRIDTWPPTVAPSMITKERKLETYVYGYTERLI